ncbi:MAG: hypothetical protein Q4A25_01885 [Candidatus Saccharibacteria bacterium]|nr:hypothetical protein [Candidatus Saccharibacteria bacterium]
MEGFELYDNQSISKVVNKITITKNYLINFPSAFYRINKLENAKCVLLYFKRSTNQIAIKFLKSYDERGFKISGSDRLHSGGYITAKNFFAVNGLVGEIRTGRYDYSNVKIRENGFDYDDLFVLQLEKIIN